MSKVTKKRIGNYIYSGETRSNVPHGFGSYEVVEGAEKGNLFVGRFEDGKMVKGKYTFGTGDCYDGDVYDGDLLDGMSHGMGVNSWASGGVYEGQWKAGKKDGFGIVWLFLILILTFKYTSPDEWEYIGQFKNDAPCGLGVQTEDDVSVFRGEWLDHSLHGRIVFSSRGISYQ